MDDRRKKIPPVLQVDDMEVDFVRVQNYELLTQREIRIPKDFLRLLRHVLPDALGYAHRLKKSLKMPRTPDLPDIMIRILSETYFRKNEMRLAVDVMSDGSIFLLRLAGEMPNPKPFLASIDMFLSDEKRE